LGQFTERSVLVNCRIGRVIRRGINKLKLVMVWKGRCGGKRIEMERGFGLGEGEGLLKGGFGLVC
ncbi:hypothetical protein, partial [Staphylococcus saprophyticus]|uniref:hypothetical protein n=1 Tax=Staphylococcus saprophyticus TaxID=29385 RepID=UPI001C931342